METHCWEADWKDSRNEGLQAAGAGQELCWLNLDQGLLAWLGAQGLWLSQTRRRHRATL